MAHVYITGVKAASWRDLLVHWWQWALFGICIAAISVGLAYLTFLLSRKIYRRLKQKRDNSNALRLRVANYLQKFSNSRSSLSLTNNEKSPPTSFKAFLGAFQNPVSTSQFELLAENDMIILDPAKENVTSALEQVTRYQRRPRHIFGRIDLRSFSNAPKTDIVSEKSVLSFLDQVITSFSTYFEDAEGYNNKFTGVLLAGCNVLPTPIFHELSTFFAGVGLEVYIETQCPEYLNDPLVLSTESISGLLVRNGLIKANGERQDYFDMEAFNPTVKSFMSQSCQRPFAVLAWETLDDEVVLSNAVLKRTFNWCNFHNVILWAAPEAAIFDASIRVACIEPLSAFDWLKEPRVMDLHEQWRNNKKVQYSSRHQTPSTQLDEMLPSIQKAGKDCSCNHGKIKSKSAASNSVSTSQEWFVLKDIVSNNLVSTAPWSDSQDGIGCYPLGSHVSAENFEEIVFSQCNLRRLELLDIVEPAELRKYGAIFHDFLTEQLVSLHSTAAGLPSIRHLVEEMSRTLQATPDDGSDGIRIYIGLHSGLQCTVEKQFWAVYDTACPNITDIYISKNVNDVMSTMLHTFLSSRGLKRSQCFAIETIFARWNNNLSPHEIPPRVIEDIELLSPEDCLLLYQEVSFSLETHSDALLRGIKSALTERLVDVPTWNQLRHDNTVGYLSGEVSIEELVQSRLQWHCQCNRAHPSLECAVSIFTDVEKLLLGTLKHRNSHDLQIFASSLENLLQDSSLNAVEDILIMAVFCVMRKQAFEEIYMEVTDRNPLFNDQPDQAAAFSELFALGSRCEAYFDVSPSKFGKLMYKKFSDHYSDPANQPPMFDDMNVTLKTSYVEAQIDVDPNYKPTEMPSYQRFTFLSVFAIPALIDILLLTITGHGLYLAGGGFMTYEERHSATTALLIALLLSGAFGTWIACCGTYYLASMAFSAMNYFVATRLIGGFAFTIITALVGFIAFACTNSVYSGCIFLLYLIALTAYFTLLAALANYQVIESAFQSGRAVIIYCIPILFTAPLITIFIPDHDIVVYLSVLYVFIICLAIGVRRTGSKWTTWYQQVDIIDDNELRTWFVDKKVDSSTDLEKMSDPALLRLARRSLLEEVTAERKKNIFSKKTQDPLVDRMVKSYTATEFLMDWYCRVYAVKKPIRFSSAWNIQSKVALQSLKRSQLGIRFHNAFLHWRQASGEIGCTVLYFVVALLDKWVALIDGGQMIGLSTSNVHMTLPIGFSLAYYLIGAVLLDFNAIKLNQLAAKNMEEIVSTDSDIAHADEVKREHRRKLYWRTLAHYLTLHVFGLTVTTVLLWVFFSTPEQVSKSSDDAKDGVSAEPPYSGTIIYLSYVLAYTGLLWFQYTKIFAGSRALIPLIVGVCVGLPIAFILDHTLPDFIYGTIVGLGSATWTVAILCLWPAKIVGGPKDKSEPGKPSNVVYRSYSGPSSSPSLSQSELESLHKRLSELPEKQRLFVAPDSEFGSHVNLTFERWNHTKLSDLAERAFPESQALLKLASKLFKEQLLTIELVYAGYFSEIDNPLRAVSCIDNGVERLIVSCDPSNVRRNQDPLQGFYIDIAELLIQVAAENYMGYSTHDSIIIQHLWLFDSFLGTLSTDSIILNRHLKAIRYDGDVIGLINSLRKDFLQYICLGMNCDLDWDDLPQTLRQSFITRCLGISCSFTNDEASFLNERIQRSPGLDIEPLVARYNYASFMVATLIGQVRSIVESGDSIPQYVRRSYQNLLPGAGSDLWSSVAELLNHTPALHYSLYDKVIYYSETIYHFVGSMCKFFCIAFVADPEYQRELNCALSGTSTMIRSITRCIDLAIWMWSKTIQKLFLPLFLFHGRKNVETIWKNIQGMEISIKRQRILIRNLDGIYTGFIHPRDEETFRMFQYKGDHRSEPTNNNDLRYINIYSKTMSLLRRVELDHGNTINDYTYEYPDNASTNTISRKRPPTMPIARRGIAGQDNFQDVSYNSRGQIDSGSYIKDGNMVRFKYHYQKADRYGAALLRAEFVLPHLSCTVSWCAPPRKRPERLESWIPHYQVTEATFVVGADVWENRYFYDHKFHPTILTTLNGQRVDTPDLIFYDHLNVLAKPKHTSFLDDNPLFGFRSIKSNFITRTLGLTTHRYPVSTSQSRSWLWKAWKENPAFDGVIVRWLDERLLRQDPILRPYWRKRDLGQLEAAEEYLDQNRDAVIASVDLDNSISGWTPLATKINDLYSFGQGGDAVSRTRTNTIEQDGDGTALHVIAVDTGTWPNEGGGVSACRTDVVNNLRTIKWHMVSEAANDFGIPKSQIERNIHSLKIIPLWGLDLLTPIHGLFANRLDSEIEHDPSHITLIDIQRNFVPILAALVNCARAVEFTKSDIDQGTRALINLNTYFKDSRHWSAVWGSDIVKSAWRQLWLSQTTPNTRPSSQWLKTEHPTLGQLDQGLGLWSRYLFIFSIALPEKMPAVFQASHHSVSAAYGIICKIKRGCTLQIWDHAISWRETNLYLSSALSGLSPYTRNSLLGLMRMTSVLTLHHADTILPCADFFNPNWEAEIGTSQGKIEHRAKFKRKIDPVVNGITHMERFAPVPEIKTEQPTVTMLSHVWYAKDIKTALLAADIIVNKWGFKDYKLEIYGGLDRSPSYTTGCQEIVAMKSLHHNVKLCGEANPITVLERTWLFMNSSVSEGLPLALGESALTGAPVVCTDVGASLRVLTDPEDGSCYSSVVGPNDPTALARAQLKLLALLDEWSPYADAQTSSSETLDASLPETPTPADVARITKRMYEQSEARRRLGMRSRKIVQKSFSGDRYLREHEQMLWIGKARRDMSIPGSARPSVLLTVPAATLVSDFSMTNIRSPVRSLQSGQRPGMESISVTVKSAQNDDSMSSVVRDNTSTVLTSILSDMPQLEKAVLSEHMWIKKSDEIKVVEVQGLKRDSKMTGSTAYVMETVI
ncbi:glycosyl transferase [Xylogone sp. PMI_703]|nr:glycosyl transferase [Xylogone sp. PMI_703]